MNLDALIRNSLFALLVVFAAFASRPAIPQTNPMQHASGTVHEMAAPGYVTGFCSAVAVAPGVAWTAKHCIDDLPSSARVMLRVNGQEVVIAGWVVPNPKVDFAVLSVPGLSCPCAERAPRAAVATGADVVVLGYPLGGDLTLTEGFVIGRTYIDAPNVYEGLYVLSTAPVRPGNSGGAMFIIIESRAYLIGIVVIGASGLSAAVEVTLP